MIKTLFAGFQVYDNATGKKVGKAMRSFADANTLDSETNPPSEPIGPPVCETESGYLSFVSPWARGKDVVCRACTIKPEEATPERIAKENALARFHGTGAYYTPDGKCHTPTCGSRAREHGRRGYADFDAGYRDRAPS